MPSKLLRSACLDSPQVHPCLTFSTGVTDTPLCLAFVSVLGIPTQWLLLEEKLFYSRSDLPHSTLVFAAESLADVELTK